MTDIVSPEEPNRQSGAEWKNARVPGYECDNCGACCKSFSIFATDEDADREPRIRTEVANLPASLQFDGRKYQLHPLPFLNGCNFLQEDKRCGIYETRPYVCRIFAAGDEQCQMARELHGVGRLEPVG